MSTISLSNSCGGAGAAWASLLGIMLAENALALCCARRETIGRLTGRCASSAEVQREAWVLLRRLRAEQTSVRRTIEDMAALRLKQENRRS